VSAGSGEVLADTYKGRWLHDPGVVFTVLAAAVAEGADCVSGIGQLVDQQSQPGPVASVSTAWRLITHRVDAAHPAGIKPARAGARGEGTGGGRRASGRVDVDDQYRCHHHHRSFRQQGNAAATWTHTYDCHPLLAFLDRPDISAGKPWPRCCGPGTQVPTPRPTTPWY